MVRTRRSHATHRSVETRKRGSDTARAAGGEAGTSAGEQRRVRRPAQPARNKTGRSRRRRRPVRRSLGRRRRRSRDSSRRLPRGLSRRQRPFRRSRRTCERSSNDRSRASWRIRRLRVSRERTEALAALFWRDAADDRRPGSRSATERPATGWRQRSAHSVPASEAARGARAAGGDAGHSVDPRHQDQ